SAGPSAGRGARVSVATASRRTIARATARRPPGRTRSGRSSTGSIPTRASRFSTTASPAATGGTRTRARARVLVPPVAAGEAVVAKRDARVGIDPVDDRPDLVRPGGRRAVALAMVRREAVATDTRAPRPADGPAE